MRKIKLNGQKEPQERNQLRNPQPFSKLVAKSKNSEFKVDLLAGNKFNQRNQKNR